MPTVDAGPPPNTVALPRAVRDEPAGEVGAGGNPLPENPGGLAGTETGGAPGAGGRGSREPGSGGDGGNSAEPCIEWQVGYNGDPCLINICTDGENNFQYSIDLCEREGECLLAEPDALGELCVTANSVQVSGGRVSACDSSSCQNGDCSVSLRWEEFENERTESPDGQLINIYQGELLAFDLSGPLTLEHEPTLNCSFNAALKANEHLPVIISAQRDAPTLLGECKRYGDSVTGLDVAMDQSQLIYSFGGDDDCSNTTTLAILSEASEALKSQVKEQLELQVSDALSPKLFGEKLGLVCTDCEAMCSGLRCGLPRVIIK